MEEKEENLYREVMEAANYVSQHSMMHYGGKYETVDLVLTNEEAERRLETSVKRIENVKKALEEEIHETEIATLEAGASPRYVEKAMEKAEETLDNLEDEIKHINQTREKPPEKDADTEYILEKETEAENLARDIEYTPKRSEKE